MEDVRVKERIQQAIYAAQITDYEARTGVCECVSV